MSHSGVSVVMPYYEDQEWFPEALESILRQTVPPIEVIVVDDCSPTRNAEVLANLPPIVRVIRSHTNRGPGNARQLGTEMATGEFVSYLDSDDFWPPEFLERCLAALTASPGPMAVYTTIAKQFPDGKTTRFADKPDPLLVEEAIVNFHAYPALGMLFHRVALIEAGGWDTSRRAVEDWDLMIRFLDRFGAVPLVDELWPIYRIGHQRGRRNSQILRKLYSWRYTAWKNKELLQSYFGPGAHRRRFAQAICDRADRVGGLYGLLLGLLAKPFGAPLNSSKVVSW